MPVRRVNLFNIAAGLFETRRQVWAKAINPQKERRGGSVNSDKCGEIQRDRTMQRQTREHHLQVEGQVGLIMVTKWNWDRRDSSLGVITAELRDDSAS